MTVERIARDRQMEYNSGLISRIMSMDNPAQILRWFRYRKIEKRDGWITKRSLKSEFGDLGDTTIKKYLSELEPRDEKKPRTYRFPHRAKLKLNAIEML